MTRSLRLLPHAALLLLAFSSAGSIACAFLVVALGQMKRPRQTSVCLSMVAAEAEAEPETKIAKPSPAVSSASFEDAQAIGRDLATMLTASCTDGEPMPAEATALLRELVSQTAGARGWFVSLLTTPEFEPVFVPPLDESLLTALCDAPDPNVGLVTMNVAMPVATELTHLDMGNRELAAGSAMTARRATVLAEELLARLPGLRASFEGLLSAVDGREEGADEEWTTFCDKWGYGQEQKRAIQKAVEKILIE